MFPLALFLSEALNADQLHRKITVSLTFRFRVFFFLNKALLCGRKERETVIEQYAHFMKSCYTIMKSVGDAFLNRWNHEMKQLNNCSTAGPLLESPWNGRHPPLTVRSSFWSRVVVQSLFHWGSVLSERFGGPLVDVFVRDLWVFISCSPWKADTRLTEVRMISRRLSSHCLCHHAGQVQFLELAKPKMMTDTSKKETFYWIDMLYCV